MSHQPERKEKNCLNCGTTVAGRYCHKCGQENILTKQSFWELFTHFIYDIFHFDGKFFHTLKYLLFKPGYVPKEFIAGKRMGNLDPIRMYLFTSAVFFLILFSLKNTTDSIIKMSDNWRLMSKVERLEYSALLHQQIKADNDDSLLQRQFNFLLDTTIRITLLNPEPPSNDSSFLIRFKGKEYLMQVDKIEKEKALNVGSGWFSNSIEKKWKAYKQKYADDERTMISDLINSFVHKFPYMLFVSLPFFALILKLLYIRRKQFFYSDHAVFTLYHYIFTFILLLFYFLLLEAEDWLQWSFLGFLSTLLFLSGGAYLLVAMKRFYGQKWLKTLGKFLLLNILALLVIMILMLVFILLSVFQF